MASAPRSSPPRPRGAARREALLQATLRVLADAGADSVTHRAIAAEAGLPLASTTYHFASKEELLTEALRFASERDLSRLHAAAAVPANGPTPGPAQIADVLVDPAESAGASGRPWLLATYTLLLEAARRPALQALARAWTAAYVESVSALLTAAGSRRADDDARLLIAACDGLIVDQLAAGAPADPRAELQRLAAILIAAGADGR
jgi:DNA-binding transcriptional regulator YbjK